MRKRTASDMKPGRFGELFPHLPRLISDPHDLIAAGAKGGPMDAGVQQAVGQTDTPLGYVFLGQFIDHDITLDVTSRFDGINDPQAIENFRTPTLDLDCVYGSGREGSRHLYYHAPPEASEHQAQIDGKHLLTVEEDLARAPSYPAGNLNRAALIGDPRNDENRVVSQLQLTMHYFHNRVVDQLTDTGTPSDAVFDEAQRLTRWHYQWVVVKDFLIRMVGPELVEDILCNGNKIYQCGDHPFIPIEFSVAAYRFGHSMVTGTLDYNDQHQGVKLFGQELGRGFKANTAGAISWPLFFGANAQNAGAFDVRLATDLLELPFVAEDQVRSLATRNLLRGQAFGLPSGQSVHAEMSKILGEELPSPNLADLGLPKALEISTPLWLYILAEGALTNGQRMGPVGGRIVAEVLIGLLECDHSSYLGSNRSWYPELTPGTWDMEALVNFAGYGVTPDARATRVA